MNTIRRRPLVGGNWKMHKVRSEAETYCSELRSAAGDARTEVVLFPSAPLLPVVADGLQGSSIAVGGQDLHPEASGAFTGDVSASQLLDAGCSWVLCGHSERRRDHGETDNLVGRKVEAALTGQLTPLLCVGESEEDRESNRTFEVLAAQLSAGLASRPEPFALAYEPVWAIGTGKTATKEQAQEAHQYIRSLVEADLGDALSNAVRILYGGSVKPDNISQLMQMPDIDGALVGGASLDADSFSRIVKFK